jgi:putative effector of murein hydrolase
MTDFVELWVYLASTPLFGLTITLAVYCLSHIAYQTLQQAPWANPVLWSVLTIAGGLVLTRTAYPTYFAGAQFIHFLLGPAVVALGWPLWQKRQELAQHGTKLGLAALAGGSSAVLSAWALGHYLGLPLDVLLSLAPKSVTAPVAMGLAEKMGGIPALAAVFAVITGMVGALSGKHLFAGCGIPTDSMGWRIRGFALGTAAHGIGTARALQVNPDAGAYAGLALGLQVILTSLLLPWVVPWLS